MEDNVAVALEKEKKVLDEQLKAVAVEHEKREKEWAAQASCICVCVCLCACDFVLSFRGREWDAQACCVFVCVWVWVALRVWFSSVAFVKSKIEQHSVMQIFTHTHIYIHI